MRFLHLSDLHIGLKLINRDLLEDQAYILKEIVEIAAERQPDAVVIAGDLYDKSVPSAEAVALFDSFVTDLVRALPHAEIMMISGNHDNASRINMYRNILQLERIHMIGMPPRTPAEHIEKVTMEDEYGRVNFYLLPFVNPSMVKGIVGVDSDGRNLSYNDAVHQLLAREEINREERNVLVSHQFYLPVGSRPEDVERMDSETVTVGNIDSITADVLEPFDYAALGHIHKPMQVESPNYRYCGTPMACSVSEAGQQKGIIEVTLDNSVHTEVIPLKPLHEVRVVKGSLSEVLGSPSDDYVSIVLTDKADLDVIDMQDRLRHAFPNLLEIRRDNVRRANYDWSFDAAEDLSPLELCLRFLDETGGKKDGKEDSQNQAETANGNAAAAGDSSGQEDTDRTREEEARKETNGENDGVTEKNRGEDNQVDRATRAILTDVINTVLGAGSQAENGAEKGTEADAGTGADTVKPSDRQKSPVDSHSPADGKGAIE